jgi:hypothetical protein
VKNAVGFFGKINKWFHRAKTVESVIDDSTLLAGWRKTLALADAAEKRDGGQPQDADPTRIPLDAATHDLAYANIQYYVVKLGITANGEAPDAFMAKFESGLLPGLQQQVTDAVSRYKQAVETYYSQFESGPQQ